MKHVITAQVENRPGVLARIVGLISGRGFNIDSLNVAPTQDPTVSRLTMQVIGDDHVLEQVTKQLNKLIDIIKVSDLTREKFLDRELALVKVAASGAERLELKQVAEMVGAEIVSVHSKAVIVQMTGGREDVDEFVEMMKAYKILEMSRTGVIAVAASRTA